MNIDTDTQYAFTRPIVDHIMKNYDGVLKVDGDVGNKKAYDPRSYGKAAEAGMAARVVEAAQQLKSAGKKLKQATAKRRSTLLGPPVFPGAQVFIPVIPAPPWQDGRYGAASEPVGRPAAHQAARPA